MTSKPDAACRGSWRLGNNCKTCPRCRREATHVCPCCGRLGTEWMWLEHPKFGCRMCPDCFEEGLGSVTPRENPEFTGEER